MKRPHRPLVYLVALVLGMAPFALKGDAIIKSLVSVTVVYIVCTVVWNPVASVSRDPFHPVVIQKCAMLFGFFLPLIAASSKSVASLDILLAIIVIGWVYVFSLDIWALVTLRRSPRRTLANRMEVSSSVWPSRLFALAYVLGWAGRLYLLSTGQFYGTAVGADLNRLTTGHTQVYSNLLGFLGSLSFTAFLGLAVFLKPSRTITFLFVAECVWLLIAGQKSGLLLAALPFGLILYRKGVIRANGRLLVAALMLLAVSIPVFRFVDRYRSASQVVIGSSPSDFSPVESIKMAFTSDAIHDDQSGGIADRTNLSDGLLRLLQAPDITDELWYGRSYLPMAVWFVPRSLWSEKPPTSTGRWYAQTVLNWSESSWSEGAITMWGDGLMNFGLSGAIVIPPLLGLLICWLYAYLGSKGAWGMVCLSVIYTRLVLAALEQNAAMWLCAVEMSIATVIGFWLISRGMSIVSKVACSPGSRNRPPLISESV